MTDTGWCRVLRGCTGRQRWRGAWGPAAELSLGTGGVTQGYLVGWDFRLALGLSRAMPMMSRRPEGLVQASGCPHSPAFLPITPVLFHFWT